MDRFVWFVLLVVMTHVVTEMTRVSGYVRGSRDDVVMINETLNQPRTVQNLLLYPGQDYNLYEQQQKLQQQQQLNMFYNRIQPNIPNTLNNMNNIQYPNNQQSNSPIIAAPSPINGNAEESFPFSFRPIIDSIFEIPISTLRAVNNLVARLTGSYREPQGKSTAADTSLSFGGLPKSAMPFNSKKVQDLTGAAAVKSSKRALLRELNA